MDFVNQPALGVYRADRARDLVLDITAPFAPGLVVSGVRGLFA